MPPIRVLPALVLGAALLASGPAPASPQEPASTQEERPLGWRDVAEFTFVFTSGNATSSTLGLKNTLEHQWEGVLFHLSAGAVRAESGTTVRTATGTAGGFRVAKRTDTEKTAENYFVQSRLDRGLTESAYLFGGVGWDRNTFAGVRSRYDVVAGAGRTWADAENRRLKSDLGLTYTRQDDVIAGAGSGRSFGGLRATVDFFRSITPNTDLSSLLIVDENLNETDDLRADWTNSVTVAMSENLALKASHQMLYDNLPALVDVPLGSGSVQVPLEKADHALTLALVVDF